jgi:hypothetical protein
MMKMTSPDGSDLMLIKKIDVRNGALEIDGIIMGAMPMKATLMPSEIRSGYRLVSLRIIWFIFKSLLVRTRS